MNNDKNKYKYILLVSSVAYLIILFFYIMNIVNLSSNYTNMEKKYMEEMKMSLDNLFLKNSEQTLNLELKNLVEKYPMDIIVRTKENKEIFATTTQSFSELRDKANKEITLIQEQKIYQVDNREYQVAYNLFHIQNPKYLTNLTYYQITFIAIATIILITVAVIIQYMLYKPLQQIKTNVKKMNSYKLEEVIEMSTSDVVNEQLRDFAFNLKSNIQNLSRGYTELEQGLQIERERLENTITVSTAFIHDLKTPIHQTLLENELLLTKFEHQSPELETVIEYNIQRTDTLLKNINEILNLMNKNIYDANEQKETVDLTSIVFEVKKIFQPMLQQKKLLLDLEIDESISVQSNSATLRLLIHNVFSNALSYAVKNSEIYCELYVMQQQVIIICRNEAANEDIANVKESENLFSQTLMKKTSNQYSSGKGLFLIKELTEILRGKYELLIQDNQVMVKLMIPQNIEE